MLIPKRLSNKNASPSQERVTKEFVSEEPATEKRIGGWISKTSVSAPSPASPMKADRQFYYQSSYRCYAGKSCHSPGTGIVVGEAGYGSATASQTPIKSDHLSEE